MPIVLKIKEFIHMEIRFQHYEPEYLCTSTERNYAVTLDHWHEQLFCSTRKVQELVDLLVYKEQAVYSRYTIIKHGVLIQSFSSQPV